MTPYTIIYSAKYERLATRFIKKHPEIIRQYTKTLRLLEMNPYHPTLWINSNGIYGVGFHVPF